MESLFNEHAYREHRMSGRSRGQLATIRHVYHVRIRVIVSLVVNASTVDRGTVYQHTDVQTSTSILL